MKPYLSEEIQQHAEHQASLYRVLGNRQRVLILWLLAEKERTINEIALAIGASMQTTLHHLRILTFSNLAQSRREQQTITYYQAENELLKNCLVVANRPKEILTKANQI